MVRLDEKMGKSLAEVKSGAYFRCFGDVEFARLVSQIQSLIVKNGYELEKLVPTLTKATLIQDLDEYLKAQITLEGVYLVEKKVIRKSNSIEAHGIEPDFIAFKREGASQCCYIIELKDGHEFDTKSSSKEHQNLRTFLSKNAMALQYYQSFCKIVGFNAKTREEIVIGFKQKIAPEQAMTGAEFCELVEIDYAKVLEERAKDREHNLNYCLDQLLMIGSIRERIEHKLKHG